MSEKLGYRLEQRTYTVMVADEGMMLVRAATGSCATKEVTLGIDWYDDNIPLEARRQASPSHWKAIPIPEGFDMETLNPDSLIDQDARLARIADIMNEESKKMGKRGASNKTLLKAAKLAPIWGEEGLRTGDTIEADTIFRFKPEGETDLRLYRARITHMIQEHYYPSVNTLAQYEEIVDMEANPTLGTFDNPIPYNNMSTMTAGLYYSQYDVVYYCHTDYSNPTGHDLQYLVPHFVNKV